MWRTVSVTLGAGSVNQPSSWGRSGEALPVLGTSRSLRNSHPTPRCSSPQEPWAGLDDVRPILGRTAARWRCSGPPGGLHVHYNHGGWAVGLSWGGHICASEIPRSPIRLMKSIDSLNCKELWLPLPLGRPYGITACLEMVIMVHSWEFHIHVITN